ncbi:hypothetical protein [Acidovorax sp. 1608163]|uniref:hypothetical protein n=1 Tax=Acidovorax sp. 1608163 TaxID=2478662 RepID=UPI0013CE4E0B|nr:hypothetical protein [Acidovorax sp. 1608163]
MSNTSIAERVLEIAEKYAAGIVPASAIAASLELHLSALEGISKEVRDRLHALSVLVIAEDVLPHEAEGLGLLPSRNSLSELQRILRQL